MKRINVKQIALTLAVIAWTGLNVLAAGSGELLQQGLYAEEIEGDLPAAIGFYEAIITDPAAPAEHVAQALYREAICLVRLHNESRAVALLNRVINDFPEQVDLTARARQALAELEYFDPAALMPPDTMVYLELGSPGTQLERLLQLLDVSSTDELIAPLTPSTGVAIPEGSTMELSAGPNATITLTPSTGVAIPEGSTLKLSDGPNATIIMETREAGLAELLNPGILAELKKVRSMAVGCPQFDPLGTSSFLCVMHLGESDALSGLIIAALSVAGEPAAPVSGMKVLQIPDGPSMAYDDKVIFIAYPKARLVDCINQYKGTAAEASLASGNSGFRRIARQERRNNTATLWIDVDRLYTHVLEDAENPPPDIRQLGGMLDLMRIDDLLLTGGIEPDGIAMNAVARFKEGEPDRAYELIRTPEITREHLQGVPSAAVGLISFALADSESVQAARLRELALQGLGTEVPPEVFESIRQVSLFALPASDVSSGLTFRPGIVIACRDPAPVADFLKSLAAMGGDLPLLVALEGDAVVAAMEQEVVEQVRHAYAGEHSIVSEGILHAPLEHYIDTACKLVLISPAGFVRQGMATVTPAPTNGSLDQQVTEQLRQLTAVLESTILSVHTEEHDHQLVLSAGLNGVPSLGELVPAIAGVQQVITEVEKQQAEAEARAWAERLDELLDLPPARVVGTATAPVIDGAPDEVWTRAVRYDLARTIYVNPGSDEQLAASYRMLWDAEKLYVFIDVTDSTPVHDPEQIWQFTDGIEFYIDAHDRKPETYGDTEYQFGFVWDRDPAAVALEQDQGRHIHDAELAVVTTERGYRVEASFPWSSLGVAAEAGTRIGVEVQVNDNRGRGERDAKISWHDPYDQAWQNPRYFGRAELVE